MFSETTNSPMFDGATAQTAQSQSTETPVDLPQSNVQESASRNINQVSGEENNMKSDDKASPDGAEGLIDKSFSEKFSVFFSKTFLLMKKNKTYFYNLTMKINFVLFYAEWEGLDENDDDLSGEGGNEDGTGVRKKPKPHSSTPKLKKEYVNVVFIGHVGKLTNKKKQKIN